MQINGDLFFFINTAMNGWVLLLSARLSRQRLSLLRWLAAALLGAFYACLGWQKGALWRGLFPVLVMALFMALLAFGKKGPLLFPLILGLGLLLTGSVHFLLEKGLPPLLCLLLSWLLSGLFLLIPEKMKLRGRDAFTLRITLDNQSLSIPAFRDSGNLLSDGLWGLPVIVAPERLLRPLLPPAVSASDLSSLPRGWHLLPISTAGGKRVLMAFHPSSLSLSKGKLTRPLDAAIALSPFDEARALLPEALFTVKEDTCHASL